MTHLSLSEAKCMWRLSFLFGVLPFIASAQTAHLTGHVADSSGQAVPGVTIRITETSTTLAREVTTGEQGTYDIPLIKPGDYRVTATKLGFRPAERLGLHLDVNEIARLDFALDVN